MYRPDNPRTPRARRAIIRSAAIAGAVAVVAASCGSDVTGSQATQDQLDAAVAEADPVQAASAAVLEQEPMSAVPSNAGEITITSAVRWDEEVGSFDVTEGSDVLGCTGGSYTEEGLATAVARVYTCESGDRSGTFTVHFNPGPTDTPGEFASEWTVEAATGEFAGLQGAGDFLAVLDDDEEGAAETWTAEVDFDGPSDGGAPTESAVDDFDGTLDQAFLAERVERLQVPDDVGAVMVTVIDSDGVPIVAADGADPTGVVPTASDRFRVGSISKTFTALTALSLVDDGLIGLDDPIDDHLTRAAGWDGVTVRDLLQHTSGVPNYTEVDGFFDMLAEDHGRIWTPEEMVGLVADDAPDFDAGSDFRYSNTNYILLGMLIEDVTGQPFDQVMRARVIDPAGMSDTYLAGAEDGPDPIGSFTSMWEPLAPVDFDYTSIATSAWSAGAMVSTAEDLHRLFTALFGGQLISEEGLAEMTANEDYGFGIELWDGEKTLVGHGGRIVGFETLVFHAPESGQTAFWATNSDELHFGSLVGEVVEAMVPELREEAGTATD